MVPFLFLGMSSLYTMYLVGGMERLHFCWVEINASSPVMWGLHVGDRILPSPLFHPLLRPHAGRPLPCPPKLRLRGCSSSGSHRMDSRSLRPSSPRSSSAPPSPPSSGRAHPRCPALPPELRSSLLLCSARDGASPTAALRPSFVCSGRAVKLHARAPARGRGGGHDAAWERARSLGRS